MQQKHVYFPSVSFSLPPPLSLYLYLSFPISIYLSLGHYSSFSLSVYLTVCLSVCLPVFFLSLNFCLSVCLSVHLFLETWARLAGLIQICICRALIKATKKIMCCEYIPKFLDFKIKWKSSSWLKTWFLQNFTFLLYELYEITNKIYSA